MSPQPPSSAFSDEHGVVPVLEAQGLVKRFALASRRGSVSAVEDVSFSVVAGRTLGLVGESGSGKTTVARLALQVISPTAGVVLFDGNDVSGFRGEHLRCFRREAQMVFQDPYSSLDPKMKIADIVMEPLNIHRVGTRRERHARVGELLEVVQLRPELAELYPQQLSGGQRQRVGIARALALRPRLLVCDEPTSALDVSVQAQILNLLKELQSSFGLACLFISHDLAVVRFVADEIAVLYLGKLVEVGPKVDVLLRSLHPYTRALVAAVPQPNVSRQRAPILVEGEIPSASNPPSGCRYHPRCPMAQGICSEREPELRDVEHGRLSACHFAEDVAARTEHWRKLPGKS